MDTTHQTETMDDLSALAWVHEELRRSLEAAHKLLRRYVKEAESTFGSDIDSVDPSVLRNARAQLHQGVGALEMIGLPAAANVLRASELAVQRAAGKSRKLDNAAVDAIEKASFALLDYLARMLSAKPVSPLALFPQYRAVQMLAGTDRVHPADLWNKKWEWRELPHDPKAAPRTADAALHDEIETLLLALMRGRAKAAAVRMSELLAGLGEGTQDAQTATLWRLAAAVFEAQAQDLLESDVYCKRIASRLLAQLRIAERGETQPSQRLGQDLLFFCAQSIPPINKAQAPRLWAVRRAFELGDTLPVGYEAVRLGRFDPAWIAQARKRVAGAKDAWSGVAGGELHRLAGLNEQFALIGDSLERLYPDGDKLSHALLDAAARTVQSGVAPPPPLAMEVATGLLYLEASLEDGEFDHPEQGERVQRLAQRIGSVAQGAAADPLEPWMEELYRRVSDRQTMGSVVQELRGSLSEVEKEIDQYFRNPAERQVLIPVANQLQSMRGVLSVLGMEQASHAVVHMRDEVENLANTDVDPEHARQSGLFDRLAGNLGALGFLIDMLSVQPQTAKSLFIYNAAEGVLSPVMGRHKEASAFGPFAEPPSPPGMPEPKLVEQAQSVAVAAASHDVPLEKISLDLAELSEHAALADQPGLAAAVSTAQAALEHATDASSMQAAREEIAQVIGDFVSTASDAATLVAPQAPALQPAPHPAPVEPPVPKMPVTAPPAVVNETGLEDDLEMREVFLEEAAEVMQNAREALAALVDEPDDVAQLTTVRRAFHTLKGSSRMVGLNAFGEGAWAFEQLYNARLADAPHADAALLELTQSALAYLGDWIEHLASSRRGGHGFEPLKAAAEAMRLENRLMLVPMPGAATADASPDSEPDAHPTLTLPNDLPSEADLELSLPAVEEVSFALDLGLADQAAAPAEPEPMFAEPAEEAPVVALPEDAPVVAETAEPAAGDAVDPEQVKVVGDLRIGIPLFNIYLNEADEQSRRLSTELAEWAHELHRPVGESAVALAHSLAGNSATVGFTDLSQLARSLEHALARSNAYGPGEAAEAKLFTDTAEEIRHLLHQFAAGFLKSPPAELLQRLAEQELIAVRKLEQKAARPEVVESTPMPLISEEAPLTQPAPLVDLGHVELKPLAELPSLETIEHQAVHASVDAPDDEDDIDAVDAVDAELFPIFEEEGLELLPQLESRMREWVQHPGDNAGATACMRTLHTLKGSARLAGAMRLGEMAHRLETAIEHVLAHGSASPSDFDALQSRVDALTATFEALRSNDAQAYAAASAKAEQAVRRDAVPTQPAAPTAAQGKAPGQAPTDLTAIDWSRFVSGASADQAATGERSAALASQAAVRVRAQLLDRLVNQAGEVSIRRSRIESNVGTLKGSLNDLTENLERLRRQLRDIEVQAETQIASRMEAAKAMAQEFDPLEFDRFTRFQELTRMMVESVNDVATVQRTLQRTLQSTEDELVAQERLTRDLQDDLLRTRMVEFEGLSERLYRVVRLAAKETGKHVRLDIIGGNIEMDRGVLDRMTGSFEHLLRNCITHGIESPQERAAAGKDQTGNIAIALSHEGNEVAIEFRDDGAGLQLNRIRERGVAMGLIDGKGNVSDSDLANLIFTPGFSTAKTVTELAGRGIGMDVVKTEVNAMGGRIETATQAGKGTSFKLVLPLTTAVTQVVMLRCGETTVAVPTTLIEIVRRTKTEELDQCYATQAYAFGDATVPFFWLGALLQGSGRSVQVGRMRPVVVIRSAQQRVALHVDEVLGNQEVVVKNLGPQLSRLPGLAGMTLLASGAVALIYNPVALATLYGDSARALMREAQEPVKPGKVATEAAAPLAPLVLVVDDSLTVRRVTQRLLSREGYRVTVAKDGLEALERLAEERPTVLLSDIEMPRMDGFDLVRNVRGDDRWRNLPVIMITSRIAQKHRDVAAELGVDHYLGKPYSEEDLLALVGRYASAPATA